MGKEMVSSNWWSESHEEFLPARLSRGGREECGGTLLGSSTLREEEEGFPWVGSWVGLRYQLGP